MEIELATRSAAVNRSGTVPTVPSINSDIDWRAENDHMLWCSHEKKAIITTLDKMYVSIMPKHPEDDH